MRLHLTYSFFELVTPNNEEIVWCISDKTKTFHLIMIKIVIY